MKRFGMYNNDFNSLFECYEQVSGVVTERDLPKYRGSSPVSVNTGSSFDDINSLSIQKIKNKRPVEDQISKSYMAKNVTIISDDGQGGVILSGETEDGYILHVTIVYNDQTASVVVTRDGGEMERLEVRETESVSTPIVISNNVMRITYDLSGGESSESI